MARQRQTVRLRQDQSFKGRQFTAEVILWAVRWYLKKRIRPHLRMSNGSWRVDESVPQQAA